MSTLLGSYRAVGPTSTTIGRRMLAFLHLLLLFLPGGLAFFSLSASSSRRDLPSFNPVSRSAHILHELRGRSDCEKICISDQIFLQLRDLQLFVSRIRGGVIFGVIELRLIQGTRSCESASRPLAGVSSPVLVYNEGRYKTLMKIGCWTELTRH